MCEDKPRGGPEGEESTAGDAARFGGRAATQGSRSDQQRLSASHTSDVLLHKRAAMHIHQLRAGTHRNSTARAAGLPHQQSPLKEGAACHGAFRLFSEVSFPCGDTLPLARRRA